MAPTTNSWDAYNLSKTTKKGNLVRCDGIDSKLIESLCRYGDPHPNFYVGTLEEALNEACHKPAKDVSRANAYKMFRSLIVLSSNFCSANC